MKLKYSLFALIALAVSGCQKAPVYDDVVYIAGAEGEVPTLSLTLDDQFPKELSVKVSSSIVVGHDTKVRLVTDPSKIEEYNTQYGKKGVMLPETNFVLKNTELTIPAGSFSTAEPLVVSVTKDEGLKEGVSYVIPLSIESVDGDLKVKEGFRTVFVESAVSSSARLPTVQAAPISRSISPRASRTNTTSTTWAKSLTKPASTCSAGAAGAIR